MTIVLGAVRTPFDGCEDLGVTEWSGKWVLGQWGFYPERTSFDSSGQCRVIAVEQGNALERAA